MSKRGGTSSRFSIRGLKDQKSKKLEHPVPLNLIEKIGDIVVSFTLLEDVVQSLTYSLITENQQIGRIIIAGRSFRSLRELLISIYVEKFGKDEEYDELRKLLKRTNKIEEKRNQIVHSVWAAGGTKESIHRIKSTIREKTGYQKIFENVTEEDLVNISDETKKIAYEISIFTFDLMKKGKLSKISKIY